MTLDTAVIPSLYWNLDEAAEAGLLRAFSGDALREFEEVGRSRFFDVL